jgi:ABC-type lipoprotein export system ATPase subunit
MLYFVVNKRDFLCITGESGQGKTTLLKILSRTIETSNVFVNKKFQTIT